MADKKKYVQVRNALSTRIAAMKTGDKLPTESELCDEYSVSRITIRRAIEELERDGLLKKVQGRGTFVTAPTFTTFYEERFADHITGLYRQQQARGAKVTTAVLSQRIVTNADAASRLGVDANEKLIELVRLRYVNEKLHQHVVTWLPFHRYPLALGQDFTQGSLFDYLESDYDVFLARNDLHVRVATPPADVVAGLKLTTSVPLLAIESTVYVADGTPVAHGIAHNTPETSEIFVSMNNTHSGTPSRPPLPRFLWS